MTNHDKIAVVVKPSVGMTLSTRQVQALVLGKYPDTNPTSIIPSDHSGPNPRSGRSYCHCSGNSAQIFMRDSGGYKVLGAGTVLGCTVPSTIPALELDALRNSPLVIDDAFIAEWHPKYDWIQNDEIEYQRLLPVVAQDIALTGTISKDTFLAIWNWKGAMRVIGHILLSTYDTLYASAFRRAASEPTERKLAALIAPSVKLPGVEAATGSTVIHFMLPQLMPIIDVRTIGVLFVARLISTKSKDLAHYEEFRRAIDGIRRRCPSWTLRQIDRALFAYHKLVLDKGKDGGCR
jgi:hypothetical protein